MNTDELKDTVENQNEKLKANDDLQDAKTTNLETDAEDLSANATADPKNWEEEFKKMEDKYLRLYAEFDNYRKRTMQERIDLIKTANQEVLVAMLPIADDFERALKAMQQTTDIQSLTEGVSLVQQKFKHILTTKGIKPMEALGEVFNPDIHEAITKIPSPSADMAGKILDVVEPGYFLGDKVIRFAKVVVGE